MTYLGYDFWNNFFAFGSVILVILIFLTLSVFIVKGVAKKPTADPSEKLFYKKESLEPATNAEVARAQRIMRGRSGI